MNKSKSTSSPQTLMLAWSILPVVGNENARRHHIEARASSAEWIVVIIGSMLLTLSRANMLILYECLKMRKACKNQEKIAIGDVSDFLTIQGGDSRYRLRGL